MRQLTSYHRSSDHADPPSTNANLAQSVSQANYPSSQQNVRNTVLIT